ncbi:B3 domain-containing protein Os01g0234100 [Linum grandiflorum]
MLQNATTHLGSSSCFIHSNLISSHHIHKPKMGRRRKLKLNHNSKDEPTTTWLQLKKVNGGDGQEGGSNVPASQKRKRFSVDDLYDSKEAMDVVMNKAQEIKANLPNHHPVLLKMMLPSYVQGGFSLSMAKDFCDDHLPMMDQMVELEDEDGQVWPAKYLAGKQGLSGGWRAFSNHHNLVEGDVVLFELVRSTKFKVYIVRRNAFENLDVPDIDALDPPPEDQDLELRSLGREEVGKCYGNVESVSPKKETSGGIKVPKPVPDFGQVQSFEDFNIVTANGSTISSSELPEHVEFGYYALCSSQSSYLHHSILKDLNSRLVAGMIVETVGIANAMTDSEVGNVRGEDFVTWGHKLDAFEKLGMEVGFLQARLRELECIFDKANKYKKLSAERGRVAEKVANLEAQLGEARKEMAKLDSEIERLGFDGKCVDLAFVELATAPWS